MADHAGVKFGYYDLTTIQGEGAQKWQNSWIKVIENSVAQMDVATRYYDIFNRL